MLLSEQGCVESSPGSGRCVQSSSAGREAEQAWTLCGVFTKRELSVLILFNGDSRARFDVPRSKAQSLTGL